MKQKIKLNEYKRIGSQFINIYKVADTSYMAFVCLFNGKLHDSMLKISETIAQGALP